MGHMLDHPKPNLSDLRSRKIKFSRERKGSVDRQYVESQLFCWMEEVVRRTKQHSRNFNGVYAMPETILMLTAKASIETLMLEPPLAPDVADTSYNERLVYADLDSISNWSRYTDGHWYLARVSFDLYGFLPYSVRRDSPAEFFRERARKEALKDRLLEQAEERNALNTPLRSLVFPIKQHIQTLAKDINVGRTIINANVARAYEQTKQDVPMLKNPATALNLAVDLLSFGVEHIPPEAAEVTRSDKLLRTGNATLEKQVADYRVWSTFSERTQEVVYFQGEYLSMVRSEQQIATLRRLQKTYKTVEVTRHIGNMAAGPVMDLKEDGAVNLDAALDLSVDGASFIPGAGSFIEPFAGMIYDIAISNDASRVSKFRCRCYIYFVAGYIHTLTTANTGTPRCSLDKKYFNLGANAAAPVGVHWNFPQQLYLLDWTARNYHVPGGWGGLSYHPLHWSNTDDAIEWYTVNWSPQRLASALTLHLCTPEYLYDDGSTRNLSLY